MTDAAKSSSFLRPAIAGALALAAVDQAVTAWIVDGLKLPLRPNGRIELPGVVDLTFVQNTGASFGILPNGGQASRVVLSLLALATTALLIHFVRGTSRRGSAAGVALIMAGALGNLCDRLRLGYVVDYIDASALGFPWVFNLADVFVNIGVAVLAIDLMRAGRAPETSRLPAGRDHSNTPGTTSP
jgi:signal peptidase II